MKKICIISQSHVCRNPRVWKEAICLDKAGYEVYIYTTIYSASLLAEDQSLLEGSNVSLKVVVDLTKRGLISFFLKAIRKGAEWVVKTFNLQIPDSLGYGYGVYLKELKRLNADLYIAHQEMPTVLGISLLRKGFNVAFDLEDWYSKDLLPEARKKRPLELLEKCEKEALNSGAYVVTTSNAMAQALSNFYNVGKPHVIYNTFPLAESLNSPTNERTDYTKKSLIWFSQTIGSGRGLEILLEALKFVEIPLELHLRGNVDENYKQFLLSKLTSLERHELYFHSLVSNQLLIACISQHDVGLALELDETESRNFTVTNKILQYLLAGIPVIATKTKGQEEVAQNSLGSILLFDGNDPQQLADKLNQILTNELLLMELKVKAMEAYKANFNWESQEIKLIKLVKEALHDSN